MYRIDDPTASPTLPTPEAALTEGYWTEGNPGTGVPATLERASWFNMIQEELRAVVVAAGLTPSKTTYTQIRDAIKTLYGPGRLLNIQYITSSGTYTPTTGTNSIVVEGAGGGGAGGGAPSTASSTNFAAGGGGGSGCWGRKRYTANFAGATMVIGTAGTGVAGGVGNTGGQTSFTPTIGTAMILPGGLGGNVGGPAGSSTFFYAQGGASAAAFPTGLDCGTSGWPGAYGTCFNGLAIGGNGASHPLGTQGGGSGGSAGQAATFGFGAAGGGASATNSAALAGGAGRPGVLIIYEYA